jgi:hypothetical protein
MEWAALVPQRDRMPDGTPTPANKWGLKPEATAIRSLVVYLELSGQGQARWLRNEMEALRQTAKELDGCCAVVALDHASVVRLSKVAVEQATVLASLLRRVARRLPAETEGRADACARRLPPRKRGAPTRRSLGDDLRLVRAWEHVRGKAGMTRKQFCANQGVSIAEFIRAQDNARKHYGPTAAE